MTFLISPPHCTAVTRLFVLLSLLSLLSLSCTCTETRQGTRQNSELRCETGFLFNPSLQSIKPVQRIHVKKIFSVILMNVNEHIVLFSPIRINMALHPDTDNNTTTDQSQLSAGSTAEINSQSAARLPPGDKERRANQVSVWVCCVGNKQPIR